MPRAEPTPPQYPPRLSSPKRAARAAVRPLPPASPPTSVSRAPHSAHRHMTHMTGGASPLEAREARRTRASNASPAATTASPHWGLSRAHARAHTRNYAAPSPPRTSPRALGAAAGERASPTSSVSITPTRNGVAPAIDGVVRASKDALHAGLVRSTHVQRPPEQDRFDPRRDAGVDGGTGFDDLLVGGAGFGFNGVVDDASGKSSSAAGMGAADMEQLRRELPHVADELLQWARARAAKADNTTAADVSAGAGVENDGVPAGLRRRKIHAEGGQSAHEADGSHGAPAGSANASVSAKASSARLKEDMKEIKGGIKDIRVAAEAQEQLTATLDFRIKAMAAEPRPQPGMIALIFSAEGLLLLLLVGGLFYLAGVLQELRLSVDALTARSSDIGARIEGMESALARLGRHLGT